MDAQPLPDLYAPWLAALLPAPIPAESRATCRECAMCPHPDGTVPTATYAFRPEVKCCTYEPRLPNFLVGRILADDDPGPAARAGRAAIEARVDSRAGVTPLWLDRPPLRYLHMRNALGAYGVSQALRCPYFVEQDGGLCGIYRHREAMCATWFCQYVRGRFGFELWRQVRLLLQEVERDLAVDCALHAGLDGARLARFLPEEGEGSGGVSGWDWRELEGAPEPRAYAAAWGEWAGREREFYRRCAERVAGIGWDEVLARCGPRVAARAAAVRAAWERHADRTLPPRLRAGSFQVVAARRDGGMRVVTFSGFDAIDLPSPLVAVLPAFDGRPTDEVLAWLERERGVTFDPAFLAQLVDWGVLEEVTP